MMMTPQQPTNNTQERNTTMTLTQQEQQQATREMVAALLLKQAVRAQNSRELVAVLSTAKNRDDFDYYIQYLADLLTNAELKEDGDFVDVSLGWLYQQCYVPDAPLERLWQRAYGDILEDIKDGIEDRWTAMGLIG